MRALICFLLAALIVLPLGAATVTFNDLASFQAILAPGSSFEDFEGISTGPLGPSIVFAGGYTASAVGDLWGGYSGGNHTLSANMAVMPVIFAFTGVLPTAVGGYFFPTNEWDEILDGFVTVRLSDGTTVVLENHGGMPFLGFATSGGVGISSLSIQGSIQPDANYWATVDNLYVGMNAYPDGSPVPEPSSVLLGGAALAGLALLRRQRAHC